MIMPPQNDDLNNDYNDYIDCYIALIKWATLFFNYKNIKAEICEIL